MKKTHLLTFLMVCTLLACEPKSKQYDLYLYNQTNYALCFIQFETQTRQHNAYTQTMGHSQAQLLLPAALLKVTTPKTRVSMDWVFTTVPVISPYEQDSTALSVLYDEGEVLYRMYEEDKSNLCWLQNYQYDRDLDGYVFIIDDDFLEHLRTTQSEQE